MYGLGHWDKVAGDERLKLGDKLASVVAGMGPKGGAKAGAGGSGGAGGGGGSAAAEEGGKAEEEGKADDKGGAMLPTGEERKGGRVDRMCG